MARWTPKAGQHRAALAIAKMGLGDVWGGHGAGVPIGLKKSWQSISCLRRMQCSTKTVTVEVEHGSELDWGHCRVVGGIFRESPQSHRHSFCRGSRDWGQLRALEHLYWMPPWEVFWTCPPGGTCPDPGYVGVTMTLECLEQNCETGV